MNIRKTGKFTSFALSGLILSLALTQALIGAQGFLENIQGLFKNLKINSLSLKSIDTKKTFGSLVTIAGVFIAYKTVKYVNNHPSKIKFDFDKLNFDAKSLKFENKNLGNKEPFLWGVATSAYQVEGDKGATVKPCCQWERCEGKEIEIDGKMCKPVPEISGNGCDHWTMYKQDIDLAKKLGFNTFRISVSWGKIEPKLGEFNEEALQHYEDVCAYMVQKGIKPVVTLHHYADPCWFIDMGGFEKEENIKYFVEFCEKIFTRINKYVYLWFTFNTFEGYALPGYSQGTKPPFKKDMVLAIEVLKNLLESHVRVYHALKAINNSAKTGIYKNIHQLDPWNLLNPIDMLVSYIGNYLVNDAIYNFFKTGIFKVWIPFKVNMNYVNKSAVGKIDQVGLNFYSAKYVKNGKIITRPECLSTDNPEHCVYPEGFYRALVDISKDFAKQLTKIKGEIVPIYVTENGIAAKSDKDRETFYRQYLYALSKAMQEGVDARGYITWTLMDNYEWTYGYKIKYGLCSVDKDTLERKLKPGTQFLLDVVKNNNQVKDLV